MLPDANSLLLFSLAALATLIFPGPAVVFVTARSLSHGPLSGWAAALGVGLGGLFHVTAGVLGLSAILLPGTTEDELHELFSDHGKVISANIITDKNTGRGKGTGGFEAKDSQRQSATKTRQSANRIVRIGNGRWTSKDTLCSTVILSAYGE